jgi:hypothetical protein
VLVHVVVMLMMAVPVVDVIGVAVVFDGFVAVTFGMNTVVVFVDHFFGVLLAVMNMVGVPVVFDGFVPVAGKVLVVLSRMSISHYMSPIIARASVSYPVTRDVTDNDYQCQKDGAIRGLLLARPRSVPAASRQKQARPRTRRPR